MSKKRTRTHELDTIGLLALDPGISASLDAAKEGADKAARAWHLVAHHILRGLRAWANRPQGGEDGARRTHARLAAAVAMFEMFDEFLSECRVIHADSLHLETRAHNAHEGWNKLDDGLPELVMAHLDTIAFAREFAPDAEHEHEATKRDERLFGERAVHRQLSGILREDWEEMSRDWRGPPIFTSLHDPPIPRTYGEAKIVYPVLSKRRLTTVGCPKATLGSASERRREDESRLAAAAKKMGEKAAKARKSARKRGGGWGSET